MVIHFRPIFLSFIFLIFGIFAYSKFIFGTKWVLITFCAVVILYFLVLGISVLFGKNVFSIIRRALSYALVGAISFGVGVGLFALTKEDYKLEFVPLPSESYAVSGIVDGNCMHNDNAKYFFMTNVVVEERGQQIHLDRHIRVYMSQNSECSVDTDEIKSGDKVNLVGVIRVNPVFRSSSINSYAYKNDFQHTVYPDPLTITLETGSPNVFDSLKNSVHDLYKDNIDSPYAGFAYSVFSGDRSDLDRSIVNSFSSIGIAHIVAISGLHVGFLVLLLMWILSRLRVNKWARFSVVCVVLALYAFFFGASPSVVRASLMAIFLMLGNLLGKQTDNLNSVSLAGIVILLFSPLYIFDLGFILSFAGVFGIFFLYPVFKDAFAFLKFKWLIEGVALTLAADIATLPIIANAFGYVSVLSLIANLILVPLFGWIFMLMFVITILVLILPFMKFLLAIVEWGIWLLIESARLLASLPFASFNFAGFGVGALLSYYGGMFCSSRYLVVAPKYKIALITVCYVIFASILLALLV